MADETLPLDPKPFYVVEADEKDAGPHSGEARYDYKTVHEDASDEYGREGILYALARFLPRSGYEQDESKYRQTNAPWLPLDPEPYVDQCRIDRWSGVMVLSGDDFDARFHFDPRPGYAQNREDYP